MGPHGIVPAVGAVVVDADGRLLLVQRANEPGKGRWSLPGGRVEAGEDDRAALRREMREETGLDVVVGLLVGRVERLGPAGTVYAIADYRCEVVGGSARAGGDAAAIGWFTPEQAAGLPVVAELLATLRQWGVLE
jgi:8-oxo-dGTP diphosphatase